MPSGQFVPFLIGYLNSCHSLSELKSTLFALEITTKPSGLIFMASSHCYPVKQGQKEIEIYLFLNAEQGNSQSMHVQYHMLNYRSSVLGDAFSKTSTEKV